MNTIKLAITLLFVLLIGSCVSLPELPEREGKFESKLSPNDEYSLVYIYRNKRTLSLGGITQIYIDNNEIARLPNKGYTQLLQKPGCYNFSQLWPEQQKDSVGSELEEKCFEANKTYYLQIKPEVTKGAVIGLWSEFEFYSTFESMAEESAAASIRNCYLYDLNKSLLN